MIRFLLGKFWLFCAGLIVLFAVLLTAARLALPYAERYQDEIALWLSNATGQPIVVGSVAAEWHGLGPRLLLSNVDFIDEGARAPLIRLAAVAVDLDLPASLRHGAPRIDRLVIKGVRLTVERDPDGAMTIAGQGLPGMNVAAQERVESNPLLRWMLTQGRLAIESAEITWIDHAAMDPGGLVFSGVNLELRNTPARHQVNGSVRLPAALGERVVLAADILGDPLGDSWRARIHLEGIALELGDWLDGRALGGIEVSSGVADVALWADLLDRRFERIEGRVSGSRIATRPAPVESPAPDAAGESTLPHVFAEVGGDFAWRAAPDGWRFDVNHLVAGDGGAGLPATLAIDWRDHGDGARTILAHAETVRVDDIAALLSSSSLPPRGLREVLAQADPAGLLTDLDLYFAGTQEDWSHFAVRAGIDVFSSAPWSGAPGVENFRGRLVFDQESGRFDLDAGAGRLDFAGLFREALPFAQASGRIEWDQRDAGWRIQATRIDLHNEDLNLVAWGRLDLPPEGAMPMIALFARFDAITVEHTSRYLPARIMPPATVRWLDRAIKGGVSPRGDLVFHGPLRGFPFDSGTGRFKVDFDLEQGSLEYSPGWPAIDEIVARVVFDGRRMDIAARDGASWSSRIVRADVEIPNLTARPALLKVRGHARGETLDALRYLLETPLAHRFGALARDAVASGSSTLDLGLSIPLDGSPAQIDGDIRFIDSTLLLVDETIDITKINGHLKFTGEGVSTDGIDAEILGLPALVTVAPRLEDGAAGALVEAAGRANGSAITGLIDLAPLRHVEGEAAWHARLRVPFGDDLPVSETGAELRIVSDLTGIALTLPEPLGKPAEAALPLTIRIPLPREPDLPVYFALGATLSAAFTLDDRGGIERGELRFGAGDATLPERPGLRISGSTDALAYEPWVAIFDEADDRSGAARGIVNAIDLRIGSARLFGREFNAMHVDAQRDSDAWTAEVDSEEIAGRIVVPHEDGHQWRADLKHLYLAALESDGDQENSVDPRTLPPMRIDSERFHYGGINFGSMSLLSSRRPAGVHMDRLLLSSARTRIDARGDWVVAGERQFSSFNIDFSTGDFGSALANFGYADTIRGGKGTAVVSARWHGPPTAFALDRLDGSLELSISDGRLLDVEPGAGRIFGLVSLQALPRRLTLDFSDLFGRGFSFDRISGTFAIRDGVATTGDLSMNGPAAKVEASGLIDMAARQYDQRVVVYPNVTSGLPVVGVVAGGVGLGAAILLMERIFKPDIDRMIRITYQVSGPWSDPVVQRLQDSAQSGKR